MYFRDRMFLVPNRVRGQRQFSNVMSLEYLRQCGVPAREVGGIWFVFDLIPQN